MQTTSEHDIDKWILLALIVTQASGRFFFFITSVIGILLMFHNQSLDSPPHYEQPVRPRHTRDSMRLVISVPSDQRKSAG